VRVLCYSTSQNSEPWSTEIIQDPDPQYRRVSSRPPDLRGAHGAQLGHLSVSLIAIVINKDQLLPIREHQNHF